MTDKAMLILQYVFIPCVAVFISVIAVTIQYINKAERGEDVHHVIDKLMSIRRLVTGIMVGIILVWIVLCVIESRPLPE